MRVDLMSNEIIDFFKTYSDFVTKVTSDPSLDLDALMDRLKEVDASSDIKSARLLTATMGLGSETGEFVEIERKCIFRVNHLQRKIFFT